MECVYMDVGVHTDQKKVFCPLELRFLMVMSYLSWVLGTKPASAAKAECACNCGAILPAPKVEFRETCTALSNYGDLILIAHFEEEEKEKQQLGRKNLNHRYLGGNKQFVQMKDTNQWNNKEVYKAQIWLFDIFNEIDKLKCLNLANEGMRRTTELECKSSILVVTWSHRVNKKGKGPYGKFVPKNSATWI